MNREEIIEINPDAMMLPEEYDSCIVGICERIGQEPIVAYDIDGITQVLMNHGMDMEEALEYYHYNIIGAYVGETTPCFIYTSL